LSTTGNGVLAIFHTKQVESVFDFFEKLAHTCSFIKFGSPLHFFFHKPWLNESFGCPPTFTYHGGVPFIFIFLRGYNGLTSSLAKINDEQMMHASRGVLNSIWKIANPTTTSS
jgi:hypothetical protein